MWVKTQWNWWFGEIYKKSDQSQIGLPLPFLLFCTQMKNHFYQLFSNHSFLRLVKKWKENAVEFGKFFETKVSEGMPAWLQSNCIVLFMYCIIRLHCSCKDCKWLWRSKFSFKFALCPVCPSLLGLPHLSHCSICRRPQMQSNQPTEPQHSKCRNITEIESNIIPSKST